jgi:hypothetical protein
MASIAGAESPAGPILPDGLVLRPATPADADAIVTLSMAAHGAREEWGVRAIHGAHLEHMDRWSVVADGDRVVSALCLLDHTWRLRGPGDELTVVEFAVGQPEYASTEPEYRDRGLMRALFADVHARSAARGQLVQYIHGIPYYYRRFEYEYAFAFPRQPFVARDIDMPHDHSVRPATAADVPVLKSLRERAIEPAELVVDWTEQDWHWLLEYAPRWGDRTIVVEHDGRIVGSATVFQKVEDGEEVWLFSVTADDENGVQAVAAHAGALAREMGDGVPVRMVDRPGTTVSPFLEHAVVLDHALEGFYGRVADPIALLELWRPVLSARLRTSAFADASGALSMSMYSYGITIEYESGAVVAVRPGPRDAEPDDHDGVGIPPDLVVTLLFGRYGALDMEALHDDVFLGRDRDLMAVLFPRMRLDVDAVL